MQTWISRWGWLTIAFIAWPVMAEEAAENAEDTGRLDRTPLIRPADMETGAEEPAVVQETPRKELTLEERVEDLEDLVERLRRTVDPHDIRDEWRLERRLRDMEQQLERIERDLRQMRLELRR